MFNYAIRLIQNREAAKDCVQNSYYKIWEKRKTIVSSPKSYLFKSVYNNCINNINHNKITQKYRDAHQLDLYYSTIIQKAEAEELLRREDIEREITKSVLKLPKKCREIFILSKIEGLKNKEIAEQLNISTKTIENQMTIALKRLKKDLEWLLVLVLFT